MHSSLRPPQFPWTAKVSACSIGVLTTESLNTSCQRAKECSLLLEDMGDYHCITMNLVILEVRYRQVEAVLCADAKALVPISQSVPMDPDPPFLRRLFSKVI